MYYLSINYLYLSLLSGRNQIRNLLHWIYCVSCRFTLLDLLYEITATPFHRRPLWGLKLRSSGSGVHTYVRTNINVCVRMGMLLYICTCTTLRFEVEVIRFWCTYIWSYEYKCVCTRGCMIIYIYAPIWDSKWRSSGPGAHTHNCTNVNMFVCMGIVHTYNGSNINVWGGGGISLHIFSHHFEIQSGSHQVPMYTHIIVQI